MTNTASGAACGQLKQEFYNISVKIIVKCKAATDWFKMHLHELQYNLEDGVVLKFIVWTKHLLRLYLRVSNNLS